MTKHHPDGVFNFDHFQHELFQSEKNTLNFIIKMKGNNQEFEFNCPNSKDLMIWKGAINSQIFNSKGHELQRSACGIESPWKYDNISEEQFKQDAKTGDIILFRGNKQATAVTRALTFSEFDHVAIVIRI